MSWEKVGSGRSKGRKNRKDINDTETKIRSFLETFKTKPCNKTDEYHDFRLCEHYHLSQDDRRRNPYKTYYRPDDDTCLNTVETMYHPIIFRTKLCRNGSSCIFGRMCSRAHSKKELRDRTKATTAYEKDSFQPVLQGQTLASSMNMSLFSSRTIDFTAQAVETWRELHISPTKVSMKIPEHLWFVVNRSNKLFYLIQEAAFENCLGTVSREFVNKLVIRAIDHDGIRSSVKNLLAEPSNFFATRTMTYGERVISSLRKLEIGEISTSKDLLIQFVSDEKLRMTAICTKGGAANDAKVLLNNQIAKLEFWIKQEKYNDFYTCGCCYGDHFNMDQGIICENGHFYCSSGEEDNGTCFSLLVMSQILQLSSRKDHSLLCPECSVPFEKKAVASNLTNEDFDKYEQAIVDAKVTEKADEMNCEFDERLKSAVAEVMAVHNNAESKLLFEARGLALQARNTVLNLRCPHCQAVYFDFSGCMAIDCGFCQKSFCGYCHQATQTSRGAHEHVRNCLLNETATGSYYATAEQIEDAQKRYRTREMKKFLRTHKKDLQNAIVIELEKDLKDLDIRKEALFELGNLM